MRVSDRVWQYWREAQAEYSRPAVTLLFTSGLPRPDAINALERAAGAAMCERIVRAEAAWPGEDEFRTGACSLGPAPEGIVLLITEEPDDFEGLLGGIATQLEALGVEGALDLYEPEPIPVPEKIDLLECRLRITGERREHPRGMKWRWSPDPAALSLALDAGVGWCSDDGSQLPLSLGVGLLPPVFLSARDDVHAYVREGLEQARELGVVALTSAGAARFRTLAVEPSKGRLTLIEGGATIGEQGWEPTLQALKAALSALAPLAVYGFVKRGSRKNGAQLGVSLGDDWVPIERWNPLTSVCDAFEDEFVPDVFGVQLLGEGYAGRVPDGPKWRLTPAGGAAVLVEHVDPAAWFARSFAPFGGYRAPPTSPADIPELVAQARSDFEDILFTAELARST